MTASGSKAATFAIAAACAIALGACGDSEDDAKAPSGSAANGKTMTVQVAGREVSSDPQLAEKVPAKVRDSGTLTGAGTLPYPPWAVIDADAPGGVAGVQPDLATAIAAKLGLKFEFKKTSYEGFVPGLQAGQYNAITASLGDTEERHEVMTFVDSFRIASAFLVLKGNPAGLSNLDSACGKHLTVTTGSRQLAYVEEQQKVCEQAGKPKIKLTQFPEAPQAVLAVETKRVDGMLGDKVALGEVAKGNTKLEMTSSDEDFGVALVGTAFDKGDAELVQAYATAQQALIEDGTYKAILDHYDLGFAALEESLVNGEPLSASGS
ncbi:MAG TPA: transporter substrate-binding domain-containing protein [Solirubrobacter sp.]|nr:transporter substrate-binding domain-containing protein [Solirubrobacter sp.]